MRNKKIEWPKINEVFDDLVGIRDYIRDNGFEETDARLQVIVTQYDSNGIKYNTQWTTHFGDSSYDQDHRGYWGVCVVASDMSKDTLRDIARDLIEQAKDSEAMDI